MEASRSADTSSLSELLALLETDTYENRRHIARALGNIGGTKAETRLLDLLAVERGLILGDVARSLGKLKCNKALPRLRELVSDDLDWIRSSACWAVREINRDAQPAAGARPLPAMDR